MHYVFANPSDLAVPLDLRSLSASELYDLGYDTEKIRIAHGKTEAEVYNEIARRRGETERNEPIPAQVPSRYPIDEMDVACSFLVPTTNKRDTGAYVAHLKRKIGVDGQFIAIPDQGGVRVWRIS